MTTTAERPASLQLYDAAWKRYHARCLWNQKRFENPTPGLIDPVIEALKQHGSMAARQLADDIADSLVHEGHTAREHGAVDQPNAAQ